MYALVDGRGEILASSFLSILPRWPTDPSGCILHGVTLPSFLSLVLKRWILLVQNSAFVDYVPVKFDTIEKLAASGPLLIWTSSSNRVSVSKMSLTMSVLGRGANSRPYVRTNRGAVSVEAGGNHIITPKHRISNQSAFPRRAYGT
jgi:hypothetical protein